MKCRICNNEEHNQIYLAKEMMFGFRDTFTYFQCHRCGCLQLLDVPTDLSKYYPSTYYSFSERLGRSENFIRRFVKRRRDVFATFNKGLLGKLIYKIFPHDALRSLSVLQLDRSSNILDVGCGSGALLHRLREMNFINLQGIDPFIPQNINYKNGLKIVKCGIHNITDTKWDLIMFHHSFEHIHDPFETLLSVSRLLNDNGICLIRVPTVSSFAWNHYKEAWVQLDAPRHLYLHSTKSIMRLAEKTQMKLIKVVYDSTAFQFWGSEQYKKDIHLLSEYSYKINPNKSIFSKTDIRRFNKRANMLNHNNMGDSASFYLAPISSGTQ